MKDQRILIVGAGPTGLGCAWQLEAEGHTHYSVIEGDSEPGGLASSLQDAHGYTWDLGGHVQFSHYACYDRVLDQVLPDQWLWHDRDASIWTANRWVPYPFQRNLHHLDRPEHERMLAGLTATIPGAGRASANFDQWIRATFGDAITQRFMIPYNQKVWGFPLTDLSASWISDRVALPKDDRADDRAGHLADDTAWGPNQRFRYPASGGTGAIWKAVQAALPPERFSFNRRLQSVDIRQQVVRDDAGQTWPYDALVSTMPIDTLIRRMPDASREAQEAATTLLHSSVHVVGIGLCGGMPDV
ncbi:MAG: FAD-dependent oxidoreductase, partial [Verrucomicrobia bacterium]|nr:FAD-dependent oxidoreductase [Verrucomicrobiota bacterium]